MMRKNIIAFISFVLLVTLIGQVGKTRFEDQGLCDINKLDDLKGYRFSFESVDSEDDVSDYVKYEDEYVEDFGNNNYIFLASPTCNYKVGTSTGMQEVKINRVVKGDKELEGECVWIDGMPGFDYYEDEKELRIDALLNYMQADNEYLIACDAYGPVVLDDVPECSKYYATDSVFGYLNLTKKENKGGIIDAKKSYCVDDLKEYEFFGSCQSVIDEKQKIKNKIIQEYSE